MDEIRTPVFVQKIIYELAAFLSNFSKKCSGWSFWITNMIITISELQKPTNKKNQKSCVAPLAFAVCFWSCPPSPPHPTPREYRQQKEEAGLNSLAYLRQHTLGLSITNKHTTLNSVPKCSICGASVRRLPEAERHNNGSITGIITWILFYQSGNKNVLKGNRSTGKS